MRYDFRGLSTQLGLYIKIEFSDSIPAPLGIGSVELADGSQVQGFVCEAYATSLALDISHLGGWRAYLRSIAP